MIEPLAESVVTRLRRRYPAFHEAAYLFVLSGLQYTIERMYRERHVSGRELAEGCRDLAREKFGPMARTVFEHWGIRTSRDLGQVVFALVDCGVLVAQEGDSIGDFEDVFDPEDAFERDYPWSAPAQLQQ